MKAVSRLRGRRRTGAILLEVMLACGIAGLALGGFAVALQKTVEAASVARRELSLRLALQSRIAELAAEKVEEGERRFTYPGNVVVEQRREEAVFRNADNKVLQDIFRVHLRASASQASGSPLETEVLIYQP
jgi:type II secretory pathway component PulJ